MQLKKYILTLSCKDAMGIVAKVTSFLNKNNGFIIESAQHGDAVSKDFFMRCVFESENKIFYKNQFQEGFSDIAKEFNIKFSLHDTSSPTNITVLVSKQDHCLNNILHRYAGSNKKDGINISSIISNHPDLKKMASWYDIPFYHLPVNKDNRLEQEQRIFEIFKKTNSNLVLLARYMQILSPYLVDKLKDNAINIHHSFLPSFKGAKPYHQAFERGVKIIGATAHYVSDNLDEGPIIEQEVARVDYVHTPEKFVEIGQDIESLVLAKATQYHIEKRIIINNGKTLVFK